QELRRRGHSVTGLAPSNRAGDLAAGRRALLGSFDDPPELIAIGPAVRISRRSRMGVPVGVRASLSLALARGRFDLVHGFEPGLPSLSYFALRDSSALTVATFFSPERLGYPPGRAQRERLLARVDALLATGEEVAAAAAARFPGRYELVPQGIDPELFAPAEQGQLVVMEWRQPERPLLRALVRELAQQPGWELVLLRTRIPASRPAVSPKLRGRMRVRTARTGITRAELLRSASIFVPASEGLARLVAEAQTAGVAIAAPPGRAEQPELAAAETARMIEDEAFRARRAAESLAAAQSQTAEALADRVEQVTRCMSFGDTIAAIRAQGGLVYVPHPFDRMHAIPGPATLHGHLAEIDVLEVYNARLLFEAYNEEALRFARKYNLTPGAGS